MSTPKTDVSVDANEFVLTTAFDPLKEVGGYQVVAITTSGSIYLIHGPTMENGTVLVRKLEPVPVDMMTRVIDRQWDEEDVFGKFDARTVVADFRDFKPGQIRLGQPINLVSHLNSDVLRTFSFSTPVLSLAIRRESTE